MYADWWLRKAKECRSPWQPATSYSGFSFSQWSGWNTVTKLSKYAVRKASFSWFSFLVIGSIANDLTSKERNGRIFSWCRFCLPHSCSSGHRISKSRLMNIINWLTARRNLIFRIRDYTTKANGWEIMLTHICGYVTFYSVSWLLLQMYLSCLMRRCEKNLKAVGQFNFQLVFLSENNPLNFEAPTPNFMTHTIT